MRESELLSHIYARSAGLGSERPDVVVGPGDDAAVLRVGGSELLITVDQVIEGRHFVRGTPPDLIARKAVARSVSDLAAMGGRPAWGLATAALPEGDDPGWSADALFDAMARWARAWGCPLVGGDIASYPGPLSLTVTIAGRMADGLRPVLRSGARPGDAVYVTGPLGGSLGSGRHMTFEPRLEAGERAAAAGATAMIDLSDGLGRDAGRVGVASGVVLELDAGLIPRHPGVASWREAAGDGEDYELLVTAPGPIGGLIQIGRVRPARAGERPGAVIVDQAGVEHGAWSLGWDHGG